MILSGSWERQFRFQGFSWIEEKELDYTVDYWFGTGILSPPEQEEKRLV